MRTVEIRHGHLFCGLGGGAKGFNRARPVVGSMVERADPDRIEVLGGRPGDKERYIESDFKIRSGLCPNGCGLMTENDYGQECPACSFSCNTKAEGPRNG